MQTGEEEQEAIEDVGFHIDSEEKANWLLRKLANLDAEKARIKAQSATMLRQVESEHERLMARFGVELEDYTRAELERRGGKRKSIVLFQGTCAFRKVPGGMRLADRTAALVFATRNPEAFEYYPLKTDVDPVVYASQAEQHLQKTGELLPGMEYFPDRESFSVRFGKGEGS